MTKKTTSGISIEQNGGEFLVNVDTAPLDHVEDARYHLQEFVDHMEMLDETWVTDVLDISVSIDVDIDAKSD